MDEFARRLMGHADASGAALLDEGGQLTESPGPCWNGPWTRMGKPQRDGLPLGVANPNE
ncbi:hypothetical protein [Streptomyces decoyicus]|uniref:hypothetical protein n=1 Tax=Streptomyces decoyicus TaxID=249567 RepID=UPI0033A6DA9C